MNARRGFTMIEILIVITIILILAGLVLAVSGLLRRKAGEVRTIQRMEDVTRVLASLGRDKGNTAYVLQKRAGLPGVLTYDVDDKTLDVSEANAGAGALVYTNGHHFAYPWGKQRDTTGDGNLDSPPAAATLADLSADRSAQLLALAEVLPVDDPMTAADETAAAYADRGPDKPFCDHWGNPLVVAYGVYQPPADRLQDMYTTYGYNRSVYVTVGALGPIHSVTLSADPAVDAPLIWDDVKTRGKAADWTETSWDGAPWEGVRVEKDGRERAFVAAPLELK